MNRRRDRVQDTVDPAPTMCATSCIGVEPFPGEVVECCRHVSVDEVWTKNVEESAE